MSRGGYAEEAWRNFVIMVRPWNGTGTTVAGVPVASDVAISGTPTAGQTLTGTYVYSDPDGSDEGVSTLRWLRDGVAIDGAVAETYALVTADIGAAITFEVTPVSVSAPTTGTPVVSAATAAVAGRPPVASNVEIAGTAEVGQTLTGSYEYSDPDGDTEGVSTFRWLRDAVAISGATAETYELAEDDLGAAITFEVTPVSVSAPTTGTPVVSAGTAPVLAAPLLIDDCESAWTGVTGLARTVNGTPTAGGSGYTAGDILDITEGAGAKTHIEAVDGGGAVTDAIIGSVLHTSGYGGYTVGAGKATSGGTGTGCTVNLTAVRDTVVTVDPVDFVVGAGSMKCVPSDTLTRHALAAFRAISPLDLSAFTKLRFRYKNSAAISNTTKWHVCLCSDAFGRVIVDEFPIPATPGTGAWIQVDVTKTGGGPMGASIGSIRLGTGPVTTTTSGTINLDDIWAIA